MSKSPLIKILFSLFLVFAGAFLAAQAPVISVQGTLKDAAGISVADGMREVTFKLYNVSSNGTALWTETATVTVIGGIYSHNLGTVEPLVAGNFDETLYLGVTVGGLELSPRTEMTYAPYALAVNSAQQIAQQGCSGQVGDIKYSILNPTQFAEQNGECWVPMDGGDITGSTLAGIMGFTNIPDMSGLFLRATEYNDGNDPGRSPMAVASLQTDENKSHAHSMENAGSHTHPYQDSYLYSINLTDTDHNGLTGTASRGGTSNWFDGYYSADGMRFSNSLSNQSTSASGDHAHTINSEGGDEARPKNMNFYIYIRID